MRHSRSFTGLVATLFLASCTPAIAPTGPTTTPSGRVAPSPARTTDAPHRKLRVALYPLVPDRAGVFARVAARFREVRPGVDLEDVDLTNKYYDPDAPDSILKTDAQVLEIDAVFLADSIAAKRLAELPPAVNVVDSDFAPVARGVGVQGNVRYAVPHWLCSNYLYSTKSFAPKLKTWPDMKKALRPSAAGQGLLIDLMGKTTLGELYFDATYDSLSDLTATLAATQDPNKRYEPAFQAILDAQSSCGPDACRVDALHQEPGSYAKLFTRKKGAAFVGYSEELYFALDETRNQCRPGDCVAEGDFEVLPFAFSEKGDHPFAFVDSLAINANSCKGDCIDDAASFIAMMNDDSMLTSILLPGGKQPPLYLLPARTTLNKALDEQAPLYPKLRAIIDGAVAVQGLELGRHLRMIGAAIDPKMRPAK
jgi:thiamine pyridinylase